MLRNDDEGNNVYLSITSTRRIKRKSPLGTTISNNSTQSYKRGMLKQRKNGMQLHLRNDHKRVKLDMLISSSIKSEVIYKELVICMAKSLNKKNALQSLTHLSQISNMMWSFKKRSNSKKKFRKLEIK